MIKLLVIGNIDEINLMFSQGSFRLYRLEWCNS